MQVQCTFWRIFLIFWFVASVYDLQAQLPSLLPPTHVRGHQEANQFATQTDLVNVMTWQPPASGVTPVAYQIYRHANLKELAATIPANKRLQFSDHQRQKHHLYTYYLVSVDAAGNQSFPILIIFKGARVRIEKQILVEIVVTPVDPEVAIDFTIQFTATGIYSDHTSKDLTQRVNWTSSEPHIASISNSPGSQGLATGLKPGVTRINATFEGALGLKSSGSTTLTVTAAELVDLDITPIDPIVARGFTVPFMATGSFSDGSTEDLTAEVSWTSSNPAVASISNIPGSQGLATGLSPGSTEISATVHGVSSSTTLTVTAATLVAIDITPVNPVIAQTGIVSFIATGTFSDGTFEELTTEVTWTSSNPAVASISNASGNQGVATGVTPGSAMITATVLGISGSTTLRVTSATLQAINISPVNPSTPVGFTQQFTATGLFSDGTTEDLTTSVTWQSSNQTIAEISNAGGSHGLATALSAGMTTISAIDANTGVSGSTTFRVTAAVLQEISVTPVNPSSPVGFTQQFIATGLFSDGTTEDLTTTVGWQSSDETIADISNVQGSQGIATALSIGMTTISAIDANTGVSGSTTLKVTAVALQAISVTPFNPTSPVGLTQQFIATGIFSDGTTEDLTTTVTWKSSQPAIAEISNAQGSKGLATALTIGMTTISALDAKTGVTGSTTLTVTAAVLQEISVTPVNPSIASGFTQSFTATGLFSDGTTEDLSTEVTWTSSNLAIATISNNQGSKGVATALSPGVTTIQARDATTGISGSTTLTVTQAVLISIQVTPLNPVIPKGKTVSFIATGLFSNFSTKDLTNEATWTSSDGTVASISDASGSKGVATGLSPGFSVIKAAVQGFSDSTTLTVTDAALVAIVVTPANSSVPVGLNVQFTATGQFTDGTTVDLTTAVTWKSSAEGIAMISNASGSQGEATAVSPGMTTISAMDAATGIIGSTSLTVTAAVLQTIEVLPANPSLALGFSLQFQATGHFSDGSTDDITDSVMWKSSNENVAEISNASGSEGLAKTKAQGSTTISASMNNVTGSTTLTVTPATLQLITVSPNPVTVPAGQPQQFAATGTFSDSSTQDLTQIVTWMSSDTAIAEVSNAQGSKGQATGKKAGTVNIIATETMIFGSATMTVTCPQIAITTPSPLPDGFIGVFYSQQLVATGGVAPVVWVRIEDPPLGLTLSPAGLLSGIPRQRGNLFSFEVRATSSCGSTTTKTFDMNIR